MLLYTSIITTPITISRNFDYTEYTTYLSKTSSTTSPMSFCTIWHGDFECSALLNRTQNTQEMMFYNYFQREPYNRRATIAQFKNFV